jgi:hypothetical protein
MTERLPLCSQGCRDLRECGDGSAADVASLYMTTKGESRPRGEARPARLAADRVATIREGARLRINYSATSLWLVDRMIDELRREATPCAAAESGPRGLEAHAGEVIVHQTDGDRWAAGGDH